MRRCRDTVEGMGRLGRETTNQNVRQEQIEVADRDQRWSSELPSAESVLGETVCREKL